MKKAFLLLIWTLALTVAHAQNTVDLTFCSAFWKTGEPVEGATVTLTAMPPNMPPNMPPILVFDAVPACEPLTLDFDDYPAGTTFGVVMNKDGDDANGVSIIDLVETAEHILGLAPLGLYAHFAADANASNAVTTFDIVEIRKLLNGIYSEFPNNSSWRFIPETCNFPNPNNPFTVPVCFEYTAAQLAALDGDTLNMIAVKVGDVDGDASMNSLYDGPPTQDSVSLRLPDVTLAPDDLVTVPVIYEGDYNLNGLQSELTLNTDFAVLDSITSGAMLIFSPADYRTVGGSTYLTIAQPTVIAQPGDTLFYLWLHAQPGGPAFPAPVLLSDILELSNSLFPPVAVDAVDSGNRGLRIGSRFVDLNATEVSINVCASFWKTGEPVPDVTLILSMQPEGLPPIEIFSWISGCEPINLNLEAFPANATFGITAIKVDEPTNGLSILDLVTMSKHILGIQPLGLYPILAADINMSNSVTTFDIVEERKLLLGIYEDFPENTSWRFFDENCEFPTPANPFGGSGCPQYTAADLLVLNGETLNLIGVKTGDLDGDALANGLYEGPVTEGTIALEMPHVMVAPGEVLTVPVVYEGATDLTGVQLEFVVNPAFVTIDSISSGAFSMISEGNYRVKEDGNTRVLVFSYLPSSDNTLFYLHLHAQPAGPGFPASVPLSTVLDISSDASFPAVGTKDIAGSGTQGLRIVASFTGSVATQQPVSGTSSSIAPNPFRERALLSCHLPQPGPVRLEVFDLTGQRQYLLEQAAKEGANQFEIPAAALPEGGMGLYRLQVGTRVETGKLIRL